MDKSPEEIQKIIEQNERLKNMLSHIFSERTGDYFICGQSGDLDGMGMPERIFVCPSWGLDGFLVYKKETDYSAPGY